MPTQPFRLPSGGTIDRDRLLRFTFDGRHYTGCAGDTLASALIANGVRVVGRSFKYHRPRGVVAAGPEEPNALVELRRGARREPNTRATSVELYDGLEAASQNRWPSLRHDVLAINGLMGPLFAAGFYYKTFMWPAAFWEKVYEPLIRRAAGLGRAPRLPDPDHYEKASAFCDVLVIGGGAAGLMAALTAGRSGARVILCDENSRMGGRLLSERRSIGGSPGFAWAAAVEAELASLANVRILRRTSAFGIYDHGTYGAVEHVADHAAAPDAYPPRQRTWRILARRAVLAAGAFERPIVLADNDRPGVMLAGAVRTYVNRYAAAPGRRIVVFTACDDGWRTVADCDAVGLEVAAVIDARPDIAAEYASVAAAAGAKLHAGATVVRAYGRLGLRAVDVRTASGALVQLDCDLLAVSGGWNPTVHLTCHLGAKPVWDAGRLAFVPGANIPPNLTVGGAAAGNFALADCLADGARLGTEAAMACGFAGSAPTVPATDAEATGGAALWRVPSRRGKAFVDFQNDVTDADIELAHREGYRSVEHLKRYTTLGMATDQGKTANVVGLAIMAEVSGRTIGEVGTTVFRPPYTPVALGALAGHHRGNDYRPTRLTPTHAWAQERGAVFVEVGPWLRAQWYPRADETDWLDGVSHEARAVRSAVGVCDVSTLGKIDVQGADAAAFLDRVYANTISTLPVGRTRYGLMLREDGFVMDDGTVARFGSEHFVLTTTTANAARVMQHLEFCLQVLWPELDARVLSIGEQWAQLAIAGPRSRDVLRRIVDRRHDISNAAFPYLAAAVIAVGGIEARLFRISFSGELAYELAVPSGYGESAVRQILAAGAEYGIMPYGTEAMTVLRVEKGHVASNELNGQVTARDLGLGKLLSKKNDFIGRTLASRPALVEPGRPILVGLRPIDRSAVLTAGAHFLPLDADACIDNDQGYMTSVALSPTIGCWIGLGLLERGRTRVGERVRAWDGIRGQDVVVEVCDPVFVDPEGERLRV